MTATERAMLGRIARLEAEVNKLHQSQLELKRLVGCINLAKVILQPPKPQEGIDKTDGVR